MKGLREANRVFGLVGEKLLPDLSTRTLSETAGEKLTRARLKKIVKTTGALRVVTSLDLMKLRTHNLFVFLSAKDKSRKFNLFNELCALPFAARVSCVSGSDVDFIILFRAAKYKHLSQVVYPSLRRYRELVRIKGVYLAHVPSYDLLYEYPPDPGRHERTDLLDWKIISQIKEDALKPLKEIADNVGVSEHTVRERIKRMKQRGIIKGYIIVKVWDKFPPEQVPIMSIIGIAGKEKNLDSVFRRVMNAPAFKLFVYRVYGKYNFLAGFRVGSMLELQSLLKSLSGDGLRLLDVYILFDRAYPNWAESVVNHWEQENRALL